MKQFFSVTPLIPPEFKQKLEIDRWRDAADLSHLRSEDYSRRYPTATFVVLPRRVKARDRINANRRDSTILREVCDG